MNIECLYTYAILLRAGVIPMETFNGWLDEAFLKTGQDSGILLDLEFCSNDINATISLINNYLEPYSVNLDFDLIAKKLIKELESEYLNENCNIGELACKAYDIWTMLPNDIGHTEPYFILCYIDDPMSYGDEAQTRELFLKLFNYCKD